MARDNFFGCMLPFLVKIEKTAKVINVSWLDAVCINSMV